MDSATWLRVQTQLDAKNAVGERPRDKNGDRYEYFSCSVRRKKTGCTRSAVLAPRVEGRVDRDYGTNGPTATEAEHVASALHRVFDQLEASSNDERKLLYARCEPTERRMLNRALFTKIVVEDENVTFVPAEPAAAVMAHARSGRTADPGPDTKLARHQTGQVSNFSTSVDAGGLKPNTWQRFERLNSAWNQARLGEGDGPIGTAEEEPGVVAKPRRRARTPLTESQVDAIRTARTNGESALSICRRFDVHRVTVWTRLVRAAPAGPVGMSASAASCRVVARSDEMPGTESESFMGLENVQASGHGEKRDKPGGDERRPEAVGGLTEPVQKKCS